MDDALALLPEIASAAMGDKRTGSPSIASVAATWGGKVTVPKKRAVASCEGHRRKAQDDRDDERIDPIAE